MTVKLPLTEVIETAKQKLSSASACLNDSAAFSAAVAEFDEWLTKHKNVISVYASEGSDLRREIQDLIHQLTRLELQAHYNISLVTDMQSYIRGKLEHTTNQDTSYHRLGSIDKNSGHI